VPEPTRRGDQPRVVRDPAFLEGFRKCLEEGRQIAARMGRHAPPLTYALPAAVTVPLGGVPRAVIEFQVKDLRDLQAWLELKVPNPLEGLVPASHDPDPATRRERLEALYERAKSWPVRFGSDEAGRLLNGVDGRLYFLHVCLRKLDRGFTLEDGLGLLPEITPAEWSGLTRVAFARRPWEELLEELEPAPDDGGPTDWCAVFDNLLVNRYLTPEQVGDLYLSQLRCVFEGGKSPRPRPLSLRLVPAPDPEASDVD
jgi:hypothetical protein